MITELCKVFPILLYNFVERNKSYKIYNVKVGDPQYRGTATCSVDSIPSTVIEVSRHKVIEISLYMQYITTHGNKYQVMGGGREKQNKRYLYQNSVYHFVALWRDNFWTKNHLTSKDCRHDWWSDCSNDWGEAASVFLRRCPTARQDRTRHSMWSRGHVCWKHHNRFWETVDRVFWRRTYLQTTKK